MTVFDDSLERIAKEAEEQAKRARLIRRAQMRAMIAQHRDKPVILLSWLSLGAQRKLTSIDHAISVHTEGRRIALQHLKSSYWLATPGRLDMHRQCLAIARYFRRYGFISPK